MSCVCHNPNLSLRPGVRDPFYQSPIKQRKMPSGPIGRKLWEWDYHFRLLLHNTNKKFRLTRKFHKFLALPPELREQIYYYVLRCHNYHSDLIRTEHRGVDDRLSRLEEPLFLVCKQIYGEAAAVFYRRFQFPYSYRGDVFDRIDMRVPDALRISIAAMKWVQKVRVVIYIRADIATNTVANSELAFQYFEHRRLVASLPMLRRVELAFLCTYINRLSAKEEKAFTAQAMRIADSFAGVQELVVCGNPSGGWRVSPFCNFEDVLMKCRRNIESMRQIEGERRMETRTEGLREGGPYSEDADLVKIARMKLPFL